MKDPRSSFNGATLIDSFSFVSLICFESVDRNAVMSQNGDEESRDAMINPVQRRESSASRFLKHFRADRTNPAYHSEGKGLRKRRQPWNSERELSVASGDPASKAVHSPAPAGSGLTGSVSGSGAGNQRSHSFTEQDTALVQFRPSGGKENQSFRWRFRNKKNPVRPHPQAPDDGASDVEWTRASSVGLNKKMAEANESAIPAPHPVDADPPAAPVTSAAADASPKEPIYINSSTEGANMTPIRRAGRNPSSASPAEVDYVNYEVPHFP